MQPLQSLNLAKLQQVLKKIYIGTNEERKALYKLYNISGKLLEQFELTVATINIKNEERKTRNTRTTV